MRTVGIDLSLTSPGLAIVDSIGLVAWTLKPTGTGLDRMRAIRAEITSVVNDDTTLVLIEGPSYGSQSKGRQSGHHERAGLWWLVYERLERDTTIPVVVVPPANLKQYATGKGNASKDAVLVAAAKRLPDFDGDNNAADAAWLAAMGADHLGRPLQAMPQTHRAALAKVQWPNPNGADK